jgi:hypothetical protein
MMEIYTTTIRGNLAQGGDSSGTLPFASNGGGISIGEGQVFIYRSAIDHNAVIGGDSVSAQGGFAYGGGIASSIYTTPTLNILHSTISHNYAAGGQGTSNGNVFGGGIYAGRGYLYYSTLVSNTLALTSTQRWGGGYFSRNSAGDLTFLSTSLIGNNQGPIDAYGPDLWSGFTSLDYNLIENPNGFTLYGSAVNDLIGADPQVGALLDNGGETRTHALLSTSPAIDHIPVIGHLCMPGMPDQRGFPRAGGLGRGGDGCEIGAYEFASYLNPLFLWLPVVSKIP